VFKYCDEALYSPACWLRIYFLSVLVYHCLLLEIWSPGLYKLEIKIPLFLGDKLLLLNENVSTSPVIPEDLNPYSWTVRVVTILLLITHNYLPISISPCNGVIVIK